MSRLIVGLDIGTTKIACFVGRRNEFGKLEIIAKGETESLGVARGAVQNIDKTVESIKKVVELAQNSYQGEEELQIGSVFVGVAGQHINSKQHRGMLIRTNADDIISQKDIDILINDMHRTLMPPGEQIITVIPKHYIIDGQQGITEPIGHMGNRLEANFHVITGNVSACTNIYRCVELAGLKAVGMILEPMASAQAVLSEEEKEAGVVLVDIGGGTTDIAIFHDGIIQHTAIIPFGGNSITEDIREGCMIVRNQAESLKVKFGAAMQMDGQENEIVCIPGLKGRESKEISVKNLAGIINARMTEIIELVDYEIINSGFKKKLIGGVVITGGGANLKHVKQLFEYVTALETRIGLPTEHLAGSNDLDKCASPIFSTGIGLVLEGFLEVDKAAGLRSGNNAELKKEAKVEEKPVEETKVRINLFDKIMSKSKDIFMDKD